MKIYNYLLLGLAASAFCACDGHDDSPKAKPDEMCFTSSMASSTRVDGESFQKGDKMGVYVVEYDGDTQRELDSWGNYANNAPAVNNGSFWQCRPAIYWKDNTKFDIFAYYPYGDVQSVEEYAFTVSSDQDSDEGPVSGYEASDLLWASAKGVERMDKVPMVFHHTMSRLIVNLVKSKDYEGEIPDDVSVKLYSLTNDAVVDLATGVAMKSPRAKVGTTRMKKYSNEKFAAIVVPQRMYNKLPLIEVNTGNVSYLVESVIAFKPGRQYTFNVELSGNPDQMLIQIGGEIEGGWEE